jgi:CDP-Glycerol:Poly(glycerophosphate) glycerophosphotransferase
MSFFSEYRQVNKLLQQKQQIIFYTESRHYYQYFEKLVIDLLEDGSVKICYITSDKNDPLLKAAPVGMRVIYVKWMLGFFFSKVRAEVMIMTMPDLGNYIFKRSADVGTYIYMFHAAVSTHQQYRKEAFFNYDAIFCTGEYQWDEIRKAEKLYGLDQKQLIKYGYPLLDEVQKMTEDRIDSSAPEKTILVAPSWFEGCIFETCIEDLLIQLSTLPYRVMLRSHPEYEKRKKNSFRKIQQLEKRNPNISIDTLPNVIDRLPAVDILITDRSGIAFEFAFGTGKPVLFMETALKETNPDWNEIAIEPIENKLRSELGISLSPDKLKDLPLRIKDIEEMKKSFAEKMAKLKAEIFYNTTNSYKEGIAFILQKIDKA